MKICTKCNNSYQDTPQFFNRDRSKKDGLHSHCKVCSLSQKREYNTRPEVKEFRRSEKYRCTINKDKRSARNKKYNASEKGKTVSKLYRQSKRLEKNLASLKYNSIPKNRIRKNIRSRLKTILLGKNVYKNSVLAKLLDKHILFTPQQLQLRLECQFKEGMSWDNYGVYGWHIDHKKPLVLFNLSTEDGLRNACMLSNLQPLWAIDNLRKNDKLLLPLSSPTTFKSTSLSPSPVD